MFFPFSWLLFVLFSFFLTVFASLCRANFFSIFPLLFTCFFYSAVFNMFVVFLSFIPRIISCFSSLSIRVYNIVCYEFFFGDYQLFFFPLFLSHAYLALTFFLLPCCLWTFGFFSPQVDICLWYIDPTHLSGLCLFALASELNLAVIFF